MKVQPIYNNRILKKGLEFAADNSALFVGTTSLVLSTIARPIAILSTPDTDKKNKQYACAKSLASSAAGYFLMLAASLPAAGAISNIDENPSKYLKESTIKNLKGSAKTLSKSKRYAFATQLFKLGLGFLIAVPKSIMTNALIPPFMEKLFDKEKPAKDISFTGNLSKGFGKIIDTKAVQKMAEKFHNTNFEQHLICLTDALAAGTFITQVSRNKKIEQERKKPLMYNAAISTGLCISGSYAVNRMLKKPTEKFIEKFRQANINSPKVDKYIEGIRVTKPALILGGIYYIAIPLISTFLAERAAKKPLSPRREGLREDFDSSLRTTQCDPKSHYSEK